MAEESLSRTPSPLSRRARAGAGGRTADFGAQKHSIISLCAALCVVWLAPAAGGATVLSRCHVPAAPLIRFGRVGQLCPAPAAPGPDTGLPPPTAKHGGPAHLRPLQRLRQGPEPVGVAAAPPAADEARPAQPRRLSFGAAERAPTTTTCAPPPESPDVHGATGADGCPGPATRARRRGASPPRPRIARRAPSTWTGASPCATSARRAGDGRHPGDGHVRRPEVLGDDGLFPPVRARAPAVRRRASRHFLAWRGPSAAATVAGDDDAAARTWPP